MNIQLKNLNEELLCNGIILKRKDTNEEWQARISDFMEYKDMYVKDIYGIDHNIVTISTGHLKVKKKNMKGQNMVENEFHKLLKDKKLFDSLQFYNTCIYQLDSADISFNAVSNLFTEYTNQYNEQCNKMFNKLVEEKKASWKNLDNTVNFFGININRTYTINKLTDEIMSLLHNFFDVYAQWINAMLFGESALEIKQVCLKSIISKMSDFPEYSGSFISKFVLLNTNDDYNYIADYNNVSKHRYKLDSELTYDIFNGTSKATLPVFQKDNTPYNCMDLLNTLRAKIKFCKDLLSDSKLFVENYYLTANNLYVKNRIYNPATFLKYNSEEDYKNNKVEYHMYFIEVDPMSISSEYQIMLIHDDGNEISAYNCSYSEIALVDENNKYNIVGVLTPKDSDIFTFNDAHNLRYRKYLSNTKDYLPILYKSIWKKKFNYYPMLSELHTSFMNET